jgi:hypothetical protein
LTTATRNKSGQKNHPLNGKKRMAKKQQQNKNHQTHY